MRKCFVSAAFFDSNILVYLVDPRDKSSGKREAARELFLKRTCVLSTQVLMETFNVLVKLDLANREAAEAYVRRLSLNLVMSTEPDDVLEALEMSSRYQISHWDGLIVRSAAKARMPVLYTEDLNHGQTYGSVRVCNPFIEDFLEAA